MSLDAVVDIVATPQTLSDRITQYSADHFEVNLLKTNADRWAGYANEKKAHLAKMLGLPHPNSGLLLTSQSKGVTEELENSLKGMVKRLEKANRGAGDPEVSLGMITLETEKLTYTVEGNKKQKKLLRQLRKAPTATQRECFISLCHIVGLPHVGHETRPDDEGGYPFEKYWAKLGDIIKSKLTLLITPDPVMLLGSGMFKNSGSCHRPGHEYELGPFTYATDSHSLAAFVFSDVELKNLSEEALFTPYNVDYWVSENSDCGRAIGRAMYYVHNAESYRVHTESQLELIQNVNFGPDPHSIEEGGKFAYFIQSRNYGTITPEQQKEARHLIGRRLREHKGIPPLAWKTASHCPVEASRITYLDTSEFAARYIQTDAVGESVGVSVGDIPVINLEEPLCPRCFSDVADCGCFGGTEKCENCGTRINTETDSYECEDGYYYCSECYWEEHFICEKCDSVEISDECRIVITNRGYNSSWCSYCAENRADMCESCSTYFENGTGYTNVLDDNGNLLNFCSECGNDKVGYCDSCGDAFLADLLEYDNVSGNTYCAECLENMKPEEEEEKPKEVITTLSGTMTMDNNTVYGPIYGPIINTDTWIENNRQS